MQSCVVFKVLTVVEVAADIVITWLADAAVFRVIREHRGVRAVRSSVPHGVPGAHAFQRVSMVSYSKFWNVDGVWCRCCDGRNDIPNSGRRKWRLVAEVFGRMLPRVIYAIKMRVAGTSSGVGSKFVAF